MNELETRFVYAVTEFTYEKQAHANNHALYIILSRKCTEIAILSVADKIPDVCERGQQVPDYWIVIRFAVIGGQPPAGP